MRDWLLAKVIDPKPTAMMTMLVEPSNDCNQICRVGVSKACSRLYGAVLLRLMTGHPLARKASLGREFSGPGFSCATMATSVTFKPN